MFRGSVAWLFCLSSQQCLFHWRSSIIHLWVCWSWWCFGRPTRFCFLMWVFQKDWMLQAWLIVASCFSSDPRTNSLVLCEYLRPSFSSCSACVLGPAQQIKQNIKMFSRASSIYSWVIETLVLEKSRHVDSHGFSSSSGGHQPPFVQATPAKFHVFLRFVRRTLFPNHSCPSRQGLVQGWESVC